MTHGDIKVLSRRPGMDSPTLSFYRVWPKVSPKPLQRVAKEMENESLRWCRQTQARGFAPLLSILFETRSETTAADYRKHGAGDASRVERCREVFVRGSKERLGGSFFFLLFWFLGPRPLTARLTFPSHANGTGVQTVVTSGCLLCPSCLIFIYSSRFFHFDHPR